MWACGIVLYTMLVGHYPFQSRKDETDNLRLLLQVSHMYRQTSTTYWLKKRLSRHCFCLNMQTALLCFAQVDRAHIRQKLATILAVLAENYNV